MNFTEIIGTCSWCARSNIECIQLDDGMQYCLKCAIWTLQARIKELEK